jgi:hypothetical protein
MDWGIGWHNVPSLHSCSTYDHLATGLGHIGPLNTLIPSNRSLEIVGALINLTLWGRESLSSCLRPRLRFWLSRTEHRPVVDVTTHSLELMSD